MTVEITDWAVEKGARGLARERLKMLRESDPDTQLTERVDEYDRRLARAVLEAAFNQIFPAVEDSAKLV